MATKGTRHATRNAGARGKGFLKHSAADDDCSQHRRKQKDLIQGLEGRLASKLDAAEERLNQKLAAVEQRVGDRLAQEIQDRPVVVHIDMSRVSELEKQVQDLARRVAELEVRGSTH